MTDLRGLLQTGRHSPLELDDHDLGLASDLVRLGIPYLAEDSQTDRPDFGQSRIGRRRILELALGATALGVVGAAMMGSNRVSAATAGCTDIPEETGGPYPGDGTNGPNVLNGSGVVRKDLSKSFGSLKGTAPGVPLTLTMKLTKTATCTPASGFAVYLWHADRSGRYSLYSNGVTDQNFLRGVQQADEKGVVTFTTIFPGCYDGRWPHMHFEVFPSLAAAGDSTKRIATSQLALPKDACSTVYKTSGYEASVSNLSRTSLAADNVFRDGAERQLPSMSGSLGKGLTATLIVPVSTTVKAAGGAGGPGGRPPRP